MNTYQLQKVKLQKLNMNKQKTNFRYSKTILFLPAILIFLFVTANTPSEDFVQSSRKALGFAILASAIIGCLFLPDGLIKRPSLYLWKTITGVSFFYLSVLIYFLYLNKQSALHIIKTYFDPSLQPHNYSEVSYAQDCRLYAPQKQNPFDNVAYSFFDLFALAHALGWFFKTLIIRDLKLVMFSSITFEIIQYSLRNVLNNFKECWWDHVIVDFFGCNLLGIVLGFYCIDKFNMQRYRWSLRDAPMKNSFWQNVKIFWTNWNLCDLQTKAFTNVKKFLQMTWFVLFIQINDLSLFFLKYIYGVQTNNFMVLTRTILVGFLCVNAAKQYYKFVSQKQKNIKVNCFLVNMIVLTQIFIIYKHGKNDFDHAFITPLGAIYLFGLFILFLIFLVKIMISDAINIKKHCLDQNSSQKQKRLKILKQLSLLQGVMKNQGSQLQGENNVKKIK